jgi:hypothetical protein
MVGKALVMNDGRMAHERGRWKYRRRAIFGTLIWCGLAFPLAMFLGESAAYAPIAAVGTLILNGYIFAAAYQQTRPDNAQSDSEGPKG